MIDNFSILLSHVLIAVAFFILRDRLDLDKEAPPIPDADPKGYEKQPMASYKNRSSALKPFANNMRSEMDKRHKVNEKRGA